MNDWQNLLANGLKQAKVEVSETTFVTLVRYVDLLVQWSSTYNLTAHRDPKEIVVYHLLDSLAVLPVVDCLVETSSQQLDSLSILDVGSGAGLPGIPWAMLRAQWQVDTMDAVLKKVSFMRQVKANCRLNGLRVLHERVESYQPDHVYDLVVCRAFSALDLFLMWTLPLVKVGGYALAMKSQKVDEELKGLKLPVGWSIESVQKLEVPFLDADRCVVIFRRLVHV
jgi:16S rRNA (guanine527-N7)-methyltransferase